MQGLRIKNITALDIVGAPVENKNITDQIARALDQLHHIRVIYDSSIWSYEDRSTDSSVLLTLIDSEIRQYVKRINESDRAGFIEAMKDKEITPIIEGS